MVLSSNTQFYKHNTGGGVRSVQGYHGISGTQPVFREPSDLTPPVIALAMRVNKFIGGGVRSTLRSQRWRGQTKTTPGL